MNSPLPDLHPDLEQALSDLGGGTSSAWRETLEPALAGADLFALAEPAEPAPVVIAVLQRLLQGREDSPGTGSARALILATGEERLANLGDQLRRLARDLELRAAVLGEAGFLGIEALGEVDVMVASPRSLLAAGLEEANGSFGGVEIVAIEGAEGLVRGRGGSLLRRVLDVMRHRRQTLLFAAKTTPAVRTLAEEFLRSASPVAEPAGQEGAEAREPEAEQGVVEQPAGPAKEESIEADAGEHQTPNQEVYAVRNSRKADLLGELLRRNEPERTLIFVRTRQRVNRLSDWIKRQGIACERVHGNRSLRQRNQALSALESGQVRALVATELPRDPEITGPWWVIYFDVPVNAADYRGWRESLTGEGREGARMVVFVAPREENHWRSVERGLEAALPAASLDDFDPRAEGEDPLESPPRRPPAKTEEKASAPTRERKRRGTKKAKGRGRSRSGGGKRGGQDSAGNRDSIGNRASSGRGPRSAHVADGIGNRAPAGWSQREEEDEARIRARAEELQTRALEARFNPSRMGIMELRNDPSRGNSAGGGGKRRRSKKGRR